MHLIFEKSQGIFKNNCNILSLAWMPYYDESKFRRALFEYHQKQLINLTSPSINSSQLVPPEDGDNNSLRVGQLARQHNAVRQFQNNHSLRGPPENFQNELQMARNQLASEQVRIANDQQHQAMNQQQFLNTRIAELYRRYRLHFMNSKPPSRNDVLNAVPLSDTLKDELEYSPESMNQMLERKYGKMPEFGWLVIGSVGKFVGVTLTSIVDPQKEKPEKVASQKDSNKPSNNDEDLMRFDAEVIDPLDYESGNPDANFAFDRPDKPSDRTNFNLRGHFDEVIFVKWNELYQKLATIDSKGNVLIWCKCKEKYSIQTPFYNRTKTVADFQWSNDGKTALICYTDSFILVGSSSGQRHWHSMLNLDDYHITCASWTPNDEQLLLGVSNGNVVVIDLPHSELTELVVNQYNIRTMCWSTCQMNLGNVRELFDASRVNHANSGSASSNSFNVHTSNSTVVNHRRLSRDCSVFSRYRFCSQGPGLASSNGDRSRGTRNENAQSSNADDLSFSSKNSNNINQSNILAIDFADSSIKLYNGGVHDPSPKLIQVNLESYIMLWSHSGDKLAVAGFTIHTTAPSIGYLKCRYLNSIKFYNRDGGLIYEHTLSYYRYPITAFVWAHDDKRIFVATGPKLHCAKVFSGIPSLDLLAISSLYRNTSLLTKANLLENIVNKGQFNRDVILWQSFNCPVNMRVGCDQKRASKLEEMNIDIASLGSLELTDYVDWYNTNVLKYKLPTKMQIKIDQLFQKTVRDPYPEQWSLTDIIWHVPKKEKRYFCTLVCYNSDKDLIYPGFQYQNDLNKRLNQDNQCNDQNKIFVLYVEFEGSLIPILKARRVGFLKPEFVIYDPDDNKIKSDQRQQRKVSDISHSSGLNMNTSLIGRKAEYSNLGQINSIDQAQQSNSLSLYNGVYEENCSDLHLYSEPRGSGLSTGRQSMSDAEHYYNFGQDDSNQGYPSNFLTENERMLDGVLNNRSHHQEPIVLPMSNNPYVLNMLSMSIGHRQLSQSRRASGAQFHNNIPLMVSRKQSREKTRPKTSLSSILSENTELARIKSNIWGTKFKLVNVCNRVIKRRSVLASVIYRASILHLQPRQIFLNTKDMSNYCCVCSKHHHTKSRRSNYKIPTKYGLNLNQVSLIDSPNLVAQSKIQIIEGNKSSKSRRHSSKDHTTKVLMPVGDSIRIAPKLEENQRYRYTGSCDNTNLLDDQKPSTSKGFNRSTKTRIDTVKINDRNRNNDPSALRSFLRPSSRADSQLRANNVNRYQFGSSNDVLTLSIDQGENVKVEMSSDLDVSRPSTSQQAEGVDDFIATHKTLKSIQSITKMILDLSSKTSDVEDNCDTNESSSTPSAFEQSNLESPNKLIKLDADSNECAKSSSFVPPDAPVHRPRRVPASRLNALLGQDSQFLTQSATTTPLKNYRHRSNDKRALEPHRRSRLSIDRDEQSAPDNPLPPPPPGLPLGRKLSSTARRFFDESIRSIYGGASYSAINSDAEPEESEPLVNHVSRRKSLNRYVSQPTTPLKKSTNRNEKISVDSNSNSSNFFKRMQKFPSERNFFTVSTSHLDKYTEQVARKFRFKSKTNDSDSESYGSDSSLSDFSSSDYDVAESNAKVNPNLDLNEAFEKNKTKKSRERYSSSVRNLQEILDSQKSDFVSRDYGERKLAFDSNLPGGGEGHAHGKRRHRSRRKSICSNNNCCCAKEFKLTNRPPVWNENSQVYQLDFGGRVTQESAKNLQIDCDGNLALQFGRIDRCTYTLDYKYPFNAVQAMAIALASLTQRLK